ncbi:MAG: SAM-dependent chlorinase/fluorinase [Gemmatimonadetes bacterium]|nr:SAM-dependent chlorinase/fluorinase [Gemmatimonadota bacterium]
MPLVTLLTDFGTADGYVAEMKGVLLSGMPTAQLVDVSHDVPAQDVEFARLSFARYWRRFPAGTVHLVVVDPDVGTARKALAIESDGRFAVGPDNGVLSPAMLLPGARAVALPIPYGASPTFHGRDVFAPAAVRLLRGDPLDELGTSFSDAVLHRTPEAQRRPDGGQDGRVLSVDRFGNLITNLTARGGGTVELAGHLLRLSGTYGDVTEGELLALVGSHGLIEVAVRGGNAARTLNIGRGAPVTLRRDSGAA